MAGCLHNGGSQIEAVLPGAEAKGRGIYRKAGDSPNVILGFLRERNTKPPNKSLSFEQKSAKSAKGGLIRLD